MLPFIGLFTAKLNLPEQQLVQSIQVTILLGTTIQEQSPVFSLHSHIFVFEWKSWPYWHSPSICEACFWSAADLATSSLMVILRFRLTRHFFVRIFRKYWDTDRLTEHFIVRIFRKDTDDESREQTYTAQFWNMKEKCKWTWWNFIVCIYFAEAYQKSLCFRLFSCGCCTLMVLLIKVDILFSNLSDCLPEI